MTARLIVELVSVFTTGLLAGILFGDRAGNTYARRRLTPPGFLAFQKEQNRRFATMMPAPILAAVVSSFAWLVLLRERAGAMDFVLVAAGTACLVAWVVITRIVNIPINNRIDRAEGAELWPRWETAHTIRTALAILAFVCELAALAYSVRP